jgi:excisionase family DNA binding protein
MDNPFQEIKDDLTLVKSLLQKILEGTDTRPEAVPTRTIFNLEQLTAYAGLSRQTVYKLTSRRELPHSKRGKRLFFEKAAIDQWLLENRVKTNREIGQQANEYLSQKSNQRRTIPRAAR